MHARIALALTALLLAGGCGRAGSFDAEVDGNPLDVVEAIFMATRGQGGDPVAATLVLSDTRGLCSVFAAGGEPRDATFASFLLFQRQGTGTDAAFLPPAPGPYTVVADLAAVPERYALGFFNRNDAACANVVDPSRYQARSGTLVVDRIELQGGGTMAGTFQATFGEQGEDRAAGTFDAAFCDAEPSLDPTCG